MSCWNFAVEGSLQEKPFGNYQLIELLGRGGMGEVWRAHDTVIDRIVAIKILPAEISKDEVFQQRFRREAHAAARLNSPHVVPIHTHGEIDGRLFVDMRLIEGRNLDAILDAGPLAPARAVSFVEQIAKALQAAHKVGLLHRDVKPSNILIDDDDYAYLIDFGIALAEGERGLTTVGNVIGTFHYMAPERFKPEEPGGAPIDARSDIYALACVLYECLTAAKPFPGESLEQQIGNHLVSPPPRPSTAVPGLARIFDAVVAKGMAKNPADRYSTAVELARAARGAVTTPMPLPRPPVRRPPPPPPPPPRIAPPPHPPPRAEAYGRPPVPAPQNPSGAETLQQQAIKLNSRAGRPPQAIYRPEPVADRPPATPPPKPRPPWWRRRKVVVSGTALLAVVAVVVTVMAAMGNHSPSPDNSRQTTLPFTGLRKPEGVTVDGAGTVYVADTLHNRVLALSAGTSKPSVLAFDGLSSPTGVTTDSAGTVYVNDAGNKRVLTLAAGSTKQVALQFTDLGHPTGLAVDRDHTVYVTDTANNRVVALAANSNKPYKVPFNDLNAPTGLVVRPNGTIYVADGGNNRVLSLAPGANAPTTLPFVGLNDPGGLTVDNEGNVYVTDSEGNRALKLPAGATQQVVLPFTGLEYPWGLAVDNNGTVYIAGHNDKIFALRQN
jgi:serine/threonine protein kinase, bacterial